MFKKTIIAARNLILFGIFQRVLTALICYSNLDNLLEVVYSLGAGMIFDLSFLSILFLIIFILKLIIKSNLNFWLYYIILVLWIFLNAVDIYSLYYNGVRSSLNSFNLFSIKDLSDKLDFSLINLETLCFLIVSLWIFIRAKLFFLPADEITGVGNRIKYAFFLFSFSLIYVPFPLNYYNDQTSVSKEARQLAVNSYFSWGTSITNGNEEGLIGKETAFRNFKMLQGYSNQKKDFLIRNVRYTDAAYGKVILIMMESFGANRIGVLDGEKSLSPCFDSLCKEGTLYTKCFACGPRTQYAVSSILYGFPHILGYNLFRKNKLKLHFSGLTNLLSKSNYSCNFLHGGTASYDDMSLLINSENNISIKDANDIKEFQFKNAWGVDDESFFNYSSKYISLTKGENFYCLLTMSNHEPFELPSSFKNSSKSGDLKKSEKTFLYSDFALGEFIEELKQSGDYEKALIIITGDHGERYSSSDDETKLFHVPLLIIDHKNKGVIKNQICSHSDIAEYVLSKSGYTGKTHFIGQGLVSPNKRQVYYRDYDDNLFKVTDSVVYRYSIKDESLYKIICRPNMYFVKKENISKSTNQYETIVAEIKSYYTTCKFIFENGLYHEK